jgi:hypothetical protein
VRDFPAPPRGIFPTSPVRMRLDPSRRLCKGSEIPLAYRLLPWGYEHRNRPPGAGSSLPAERREAGPSLADSQPSRSPSGTTPHPQDQSSGSAPSGTRTLASRGVPDPFQGLTLRVRQRAGLGRLPHSSLSVRTASLAETLRTGDRHPILQLLSRLHLRNHLVSCPNEKR